MKLLDRVDLILKQKGSQVYSITPDVTTQLAAKTLETRIKARDILDRVSPQFTIGVWDLAFRHQREDCTCTRRSA
jgi:hypothetical protein